jgi:thiol-disulfide isomerase/thioredoxin
VGAYRGQVVLINFFSTWCFPCLGQIPQLEEVQRRVGPLGLQVLAIGLDREGVQVLEPFREFYRLSFPVLIGGDLFAQPGLPFAPIAVLPTSILLGRTGELLARWEGVLPTDQLERLVQAAVKR